MDAKEGADLAPVAMEIYQTSDDPVTPVFPV